jgi:dihydroorotate dehydrogenase/NAD-dependent dihydropyrimidine dehydrogenase PreA subunit
MSQNKDNRDVDVTVKVAGVTFRSPVLSAASELVFDEKSAERVAASGVGGIVTKTFTTSSEFRIRLRPYQFPLGHFNQALKESASLYSLASPHVEEIDVVMKENVPGISRVCKKNGVPLIVSFYEKPADISVWKKVAKGFERAGADLLELNFSSPTMKGELEKSLRSSFKVVRSIAKYSNIPFGIKIGPMMEPLDDAVKGWAQNGASFITAHNAPSGIYIDVEREVPYGAPAIGGYLIGRPFLPISLARAVQILKTVDIPVFGVGGIFGWTDALQYLLCGCSLVQVGTAAYMEGIEVFEKINQGITVWMTRKGYVSISDFRGKVLKKIVPIAELKKREIAPYSLPPGTPYHPKIDRMRCSLCRTCEKTCFYKVFHFDRKEKTMAMERNRCWSCGLCVGVCPEGAITLVDKRTGRTIWNRKGLATPFLYNEADPESS